MSDFFPLSIEADRVRPITPEYGLLRGECWTTVPLPPGTFDAKTQSAPSLQTGPTPKWLNVKATDKEITLCLSVNWRAVPLASCSFFSEVISDAVATRILARHADEPLSDCPQ